MNNNIVVPENPREIGVPHDDWRRGQRESVEWLLDSTQGSIRVVEAATGSGKSSCAKAISSQYRTMVCTKIKSLQQAYSEIYFADILFGKSNYLCEHPESNKWATAEDCLYAGGPRKCSFWNDCEYYQLKQRAQGSQFCSLNYALFFADYRKWPPVDALVLDEAHLLPDIVLEHCGTTITQKQAQEWNLPEFPELDSTSGGILIRHTSPVLPAADWLENCIDVLEKKYNSLLRRAKYDEGVLKHARECERFKRRLESVVEALDQAGDNGWFIKSGQSVLPRYNDLEPGFLCRPLTARYHFPRYFLQERPLTMLMSATIGNATVLANELNVPEFAFRIVPNQWPAESRRIYTLDDAPRMGFTAKPEDFQKQAEVIAKALSQVDDSWSGIIHVTRINEAPLLGERLTKLGLENRIWVPPARTGTNEQVRLWHERLQRVPNSIIITWALGEGYDGLTEQICISAKVPFGQRGTPGSYEFERAIFDAKFYNQQTAWALTQALGRTRRGREQDYDTPNEQRGFVAIADSSYKRIKSYLPSDIVDALTPF